MNVSFRDLQYADREQLLQWRNHPEVRRWMYTDHEIQPDEHDQWFANALVSTTKRFWVITLEGKGVGLANLDQINHECRRSSWAFYLADPSTRGMRVGKAAAAFLQEVVFEKLQFNRLWCEALANNRPAISLYESVGLRREGILRSHVVKSDGSHDVVVMGMLRDEWLERNSGIDGSGGVR